MALNRYIGARYVPKFMGAWQLSVTYEPLSIVTHNGISYTSKKLVPANTPLPDGADTEFWAITGITDAQILQILTRIDTLSQEYENASEAITALQNAVSNLDNSLSSVSARVEELERPEKILVVMDSYGNRADPNNKTLLRLLIDCGLNVDAVAVGGAAFDYNQQVTFLNVLQSYNGNPDLITKIYICGGANDQGFTIETGSSVKTGMKNVNNYIKQTFTNVKNVNVVCWGLTFDSSRGGALGRDKLAEMYKTFSAAFGWGFIENAQYILRNTKLLAADLCHPSPAGVTELAAQMISILNGNACDVHYVINIDFDPNDQFSPTSVRPMIMTRDNHLVTLKALYVEGGLALSTLKFNADATNRNMGTLSDSLAETSADIGAYTGVANLTAGISPNYYSGWANINIKSKVMSGYIRTLPSGQSCTSLTFTSDFTFIN